MYFAPVPVTLYTAECPAMILDLDKIIFSLGSVDILEQSKLHRCMCKTKLT